LTRLRFHFINRIVAIRRCPYCKAIIDEGAEYCTNCGTKLLFPEDELIEEEIPGEKIFDADFQDKKPSPPKKRKSRKKKPVDSDEKPGPPLPLTKKGEELFAKGEEPPDFGAAEEVEKPFDTAIFPPREDIDGTDDGQAVEGEKDFFEVDASPSDDEGTKDSESEREKDDELEPEIDEEMSEEIPFDKESLTDDAPLPNDDEEAAAVEGETDIGLEPEVFDDESVDSPLDEEPLTEDEPPADEEVPPEDDIIDEEPVELIEDLPVDKPSSDDHPDDAASDVLFEEEQLSEDRSELEEEPANEISSAEKSVSEPSDGGDIAVEESPGNLPDEVDTIEPAEKEVDVEGEVEQPTESREPDTGEQDVDFKTEDLENIVDPAEKEKEDIERFLDILKKERGGLDTPEDNEPALEEEIPLADEPWEPVESGEEELPAWAENAREEIPLEDNPIQPEDAPGESLTDPSVSDEEPADMEIGDDGETEKEESVEVETREGMESEEEEKPPATMGLPEGVNQKPLPFGALLQAEQESSTSLTREKTPVSGYMPWMKARIFDILFIALFWAISLWAASLVLRVSPFQLVSTATLAVVSYYAILLLIYFFLFFFFLGETVGDHLFAKED